MRPRFLLAVVSAFVAVIALVGHAHAEDAATKRARKAYDKGEKLFALGRFDEALEAYEDAYDAKPLPGFLFNIGQCHRNLGDLDAAIFSFQKYLELAPDAENHDAVVELIDDLEAEQDRLAQEERDRKLQAPPKTPKETPRRPIYKKWWFWGGLGLAAAAAGTGTYLLLSDDGSPDTDLGHVVFRVKALAGTALALSLAACDSPMTVTIVTIEARPAVHDVDTIEVTLRNGAASLDQTFTVTGRDFPLTFSVETPGRTGALEISARGLDADTHLAALGETEAEIVTDQETAATLLLDPADFPVNTSVAGQQRLSWGRTSAGTQLAAAPDGTFTVGFTDDCGTLGRCDVWGRRYDVTATAVPTQIAASDVQFNINRSDVFGNDPALAVAADGTMLATWTTFDEILAIAITPEGDAMGTETVVSTGTSPTDPEVAALPDGGFIVVWTETDTTSGDDLVRARLLTAAGAPAVSPESGNDQPFTITTSTLGFPTTATVAALGDALAVAIAWRIDNAIHIRFTNTGGLLVPANEIEIANYPVADDVWGPQLVASPDGRYLIAWGHRTFGGGDRDDGVIVVRKYAAPIATQVGFESIAGRGLPDTFDDRFTRVAIAADDSGPVLVAWQGCASDGDGNGCGIHGQLLRDSGLPVGPPFVVNTTLDNDQLSPSLASLGGGVFAATWTDDSRVAPDTSETGIRARVLYPDFAAEAVIGSPCGGPGDATCGADLSCIAGSDGEPHCHATCDPAGPAPQCPDGGSCSTSGDTSACIF